MENVQELLSELALRGAKLAVENGLLSCYSRGGALPSSILDGIRRHKAKILEIVSAARADQTSARVEAVQSVPHGFPLSVGQKGLYVLQSVNPGMSAYNVPVCVSMNRSVDPPTLRKAWSAVLEQYPILTARVENVAGALHHRLSPDNKTDIRLHETGRLNERELKRKLRERVREPFDLDRGPLTRVDLFLQNERAIFLLTAHHIVFDGVSASLVLESLFTHYQSLREQGCPARLPAAPGFHEFVEWEGALLASEEGAAHAAYWQRQLAGEVPSCEWPRDLPRLATPRFEGETLIAALPADLAAWVQEFCRDSLLSASVVFLAAFQLLLGKCLGQDEIIVGMPVMGRASGRFARQVGYFINMMPLRVRLDKDRRLGEFLASVHNVMLEGLYHSDYPFPLMRDQGYRGGARTSHPVFQIAYAYQNFVSRDAFATLPGHDTLALEALTDLVQEGDFGFALEVFEDQAPFTLHWKYDPQAYRRQSIERFSERYCALLRAMRAAPDRTLDDYPIITEPERQRLLLQYNNTAMDYPHEKCIHDLVAEQAARHPARIAVAFSGKVLTYGALCEESRDLALCLQAVGVKPDTRVGLFVEKSLEMVVGLLGILQAG